jgi:hypothetical protein
MNNSVDVVPTDIGAEEYDVYSSLLKPFAEKNFKKVYLVREETSVGISLSESVDTKMSFIKEHFPKIEPVILDSFRQKNQQRYKLEDKFSKNTNTRILTDAEAGEIFSDPKLGWDKFYLKYPESNGIFDFSRVGFNLNKTQAFLCIGRLAGPRAGRGDYLLLSKERGVWMVKQSSMSWIS